MRWCFLALLVLPFLAVSQTSVKKKPAPPPVSSRTVPAAPTHWPIHSLRVEGNKHYTPEQVLAIAGLKVGDTASKEAFDAAYSRLLATGLFETVDYRFTASAGADGFAAVFKVVEVEPVYPVQFDRLDAKPGDLNAWLRSRHPAYFGKIPPVKAVLDLLSRDIEAFLAQKGNKEKVAGKVSALGPDRFAVVFQPANPGPSVAEVRFEGNQVIPTHVLLNTFAGVAFGTLYTEKAFHQLLDIQVRPLYEARGRIRVAFRILKTEKATTSEGLIVTVKVDEGPSYELGEVEIAGNAGVSSNDLLKAGGFKPGDLANFDDITAGVERIKKRMRRAGYMRVEANVERRIDEKRVAVDLLIRIEQGPQFAFGKLNIQGLDIHGEAAIKKLWAMKEGGPFDADYPGYFLNRIREDGVFDNLGKTKATQDVDEPGKIVNVTLDFRGGATESDAAFPAKKERRQQ